MIRLTSCVLIVSLVCSFAIAEDRPSSATTSVGDELHAYVARDEPDFAWKLNGQREIDGGKVFQLELTSQRWHDIVWKHSLVIFEPPNVSFADHMLLFVAGGANGDTLRDKDFGLGISLAKLCGARVAVLHQVPNQPLMNGRVEDDLITETWLKYLDSGDATWPLLFPMVKSAVKALDAIEQFAAVQRWQPVKGFVISGASKRGWTSWLTPVADKRIIATAPMVIDMLNFQVQTKHQYEIWGAPSEQIDDYTRKGLIREDGIPRSHREAKLWEMMDPYSYREQIRIPKLLIVGANDPYWATDAMNFYWDDLIGKKYIFRAANAGHGLEGKRDEAMSTLGVFFRHVVSRKELPTLIWKLVSTDSSFGISAQSDQVPTAASLWVARSETNDFRSSTWESQPMREIVEKSYVGATEVDSAKHVAIFGEFSFEYQGMLYSLATLAYCR